MRRKIVIELPDDGDFLTFGALRALQLVNWSISENGLEHTLEKIREVGQEPPATIAEEVRETLFEGMLRHAIYLKETMEKGGE
jgi:hypothetical protein